LKARQENLRQGRAALGRQLEGSPQLLVNPGSLRIGRVILHG
jgi:hypothetical protein